MPSEHNPVSRGGGPADVGTYALVLQCTKEAEVSVGQLGMKKLDQGFYVYVGSALGSGGLPARIAHHKSPLRQPHWHVDYLRPVMKLCEVWIVGDTLRREHLWAEVLNEDPAAVPYWRGFGSSDCRCPSHLFFFADRPNAAEFEQRLRHRDPTHRPVQIETVDT